MLGKTLIEKLAEAMNGNVVQDKGFWGIINVPSEDCYLRYHPRTGLEKVRRDGERWYREGEPIMIPSEVVPFIREMGVVEDPGKGMSPVERFTKLFGGEIVDRLHSGGAIIVIRGRHVRVSQIQGLDFVRKATVKWTRAEHVWTYDELLDVLLTTTEVNFVEGEPLEVTFRKLKEGIYHGRVQQAG